MRIKDDIFCLPHLWWCHNGWASNILIMVDTSYAGIHHSTYWMPIHYDTIEDGQDKKSHLLFSNWLMVNDWFKVCQTQTNLVFHLCWHTAKVKKVPINIMLFRPHLAFGEICRCTVENFYSACAFIRAFTVQTSLHVHDLVSLHTSIRLKWARLL